jgi:hypothetical protein
MKNFANSRAVVESQILGNVLNSVKFQVELKMSAQYTDHFLSKQVCNDLGSQILQHFRHDNLESEQILSVFDEDCLKDVFVSFG